MGGGGGGGRFPGTMGGGGGGGRFPGTMGGGDGGGRFPGTMGAGGAFEGGTLYAAAKTGIATDAGGWRQESIQALPKAPPPIPHYKPLTRFEELVLKEKIANRETLPQYFNIAKGASLNAGHSKGFETRNLRGNEEILVYVKNLNFPFGVVLEVKAGPSFATSETKCGYSLRRDSREAMRFLDL